MVDGCDIDCVVCLCVCVVSEVLEMMCVCGEYELNLLNLLSVMVCDGVDV